jgi:HEPN domain-containing protein
MKDETHLWLSYADENLDVAELAFDHGHLNACLQNAQQAVEKYLKAIIVDRNLEFRRTHSIRELLGLLATQEIDLNVSDDETDLLDSIYLPSKYPIYSTLPQALPDTVFVKTPLILPERLKTSHPKPSKKPKLAARCYR